jgi:hypothetical protein
MQNKNSAIKNVFGSAAEATSPDFNSSMLYGNSGKGSMGNISMDELMQVIKSIKG